MTTSVVAKSCKIQKVVHFTHFDQKNTYTNGCKIMHKCRSATLTVYIFISKKTMHGYRSFLFDFFNCFFSLIRFSLLSHLILSLPLLSFSSIFLNPTKNLYKFILNLDPKFIKPSPQKIKKIKKNHIKPKMQKWRRRKGQRGRRRRSRRSVEIRLKFAQNHRSK